MIAALMWMFGGVNPALAFVLFALQSLASAASCVLLVRLGENLGARRAGWWGAVFFALYPPSIWNAINVVWDTTFVAFGTLACLCALTRPGAFDTLRSRLALGFSWGALALLNPAPLAMLPAVLLYLGLAREGGRASAAEPSRVREGRRCIVDRIVMRHRARFVTAGSVEVPGRCGPAGTPASRRSSDRGRPRYAASPPRRGC